MSDKASSQATREADDTILTMIRSQETRIARLEDGGQKTFLKRMTTSASTSALIVGLILTFISLYDAFVTKPEADRISRIHQFNEAVNSALKMRQELFQMQTSDPKVQLAMMSFATPQILNELSTAKAMLRDLRNDDVGVPQLLTLISEAYTSGDLEAAKEFVSRAVSKTDVTPFLHSEAKRYEGKYFFMIGNPVQGKQSFREALIALGDTPAVAAAREFDLEDLVIAEFAIGDCESATTDFRTFAAALQMPGIMRQARLQLASTMRDQLGQLQGQRCPLPDGLDALPAE